MRVRWGREDGLGVVDGAWWPRSRDLETELPFLVSEVSGHLGHVESAAIASLDWESATDDRRAMKLRRLADDAHVVDLKTAAGTSYRLLVVPPAFTPARAERAMRLATRRGNRLSAAALLGLVPGRTGARRSAREIPSQRRGRGELT